MNRHPPQDPTPFDDVPDDSSSVQPHEISVQLPRTVEVEPPDERRKRELRFRHSFWSVRRDRVSLAIQRAGASPQTHQRFVNCGSQAWVQRSIEPKPRFRVVANLCHSRWCEPCHQQHTRIVAQRLYDHLEGKAARFLTLTLKHDGSPLKVCLDRLGNAFKRLRRSNVWKAHVTGGVFFVEVKHNPVTGCWHPHLHVIAAGKFFPHSLLRNAWLAATGDSYVVDIRVVQSAEIARYVAKYAGKALDASITYDDRRLDEAIAALNGTRTFATFGTWRGLKLSKPPDCTCEWQTLDTLSNVLRRAAAGSAEDLAIVSRLKSCPDWEATLSETSADTS